MALSFDLSRYAGVPLQAHARFGSLGPYVTQPTKPVVTHFAGGPPRAQERFGSAGPARQQHPSKGTQQSG
jgi:hypothetical protein